MTVVPPPPRILFVDLPRLQRELIEGALKDAAEISVVGDIHDVSDLAHAVTSTGANCLIVGTDKSTHEDRCRTVIADLLPPDTLLIPVDGSDVAIVVVRPHSRVLGNPSATELVDAIERTIRGRPLP